MKILYIDTPLEPPGGGQISLLTLLKNINRNIFKFKVFINRSGLFKKMLEENKIDVEVVDLKNLFLKIKKYNFDIIHINSACTKYTFYAAFFSKILRKKVIWHNRVIETSALKERIISFLVDKIIVISDAVGAKFKYCKDKVIKIYNPVDINSIKIQRDPLEIKKNLKIPFEAKVIGVFSRLEKWKGHKLLFNAFTKINDINTYLIVCGDGSEKENLKKLALEFNISERVIFLGYALNVYEHMNICDLIINPSIEPEPFGRVIIEAMAIGKVVIATDIGGVKEIIQNEENGILIEPDERCMYDCINKILNDKNLYDKISKNASKRAFDFNIDNYIKKLYNIYEEIYEQNISCFNSKK